MPSSHCIAMLLIASIFLPYENLEAKGQTEEKNLPAVYLPSPKSKLPVLPNSFGKQLLMPRLVDRANTVKQAINYRQVMKFLGLTLSREQIRFINRHKFLLVPLSESSIKSTINGYCDEMVEVFNQIGGDEDERHRSLENARFYNPDLMLHFYHKYFEGVLETVETTKLIPTLHNLLEGFQRKALKYGNKSEGSIKVYAEYTFYHQTAREPVGLIHRAKT